MERSKFYKFFPPPNFLQMAAVGLDISDRAMRFVELVETRRGLVVGRFGEEPIPRGIIESGEVRKMDELRAIFTALKKKHGLEFVNVSLPEEKTYSYSVVLPSMKYSDVRGSLELTLEDNIPLRHDEAIFDYSIAHETNTEMAVNVSAVPQELVMGYLEALSGTGITPAGFEVEMESIARAVVPATDTRAYLIIDFGRTRTGVTIVAGETVRFTATIGVGGWSITDAVAKALKISPEEAETIKKEKGILADDSELSRAIMPKVNALKEDLLRNVLYWNTHDDALGAKRPTIERVLLCGGESNLPGFADYLSDALGIHTEIANVMVNVNTLDAYVPEISFNDSIRYATAIGLALRRAK